jgi:hypothetical protein
MDIASLDVLFQRELATVREVTRAGVTQFVWNRERYGDKAELHNQIRNDLLQRYPFDAEQRTAAYGAAKLSSGQPFEVRPAPPTKTTSASPQGFDFLFSIVCALVAGALVVGVEVLIILGINALFGGRVTGRGLGWIVLPIMAMVVGYRSGPLLANDIATYTRNAVKINEVRAVLAGSAFWLIAVILFVLLFEPFGYYMRERDYWMVAKVVSFPIILGFIGLLILAWVRRNSSPPL